MKALRAPPPAPFDGSILISDGRPTSASTAEAILAALPPDAGATLSTLGVGTDYDAQVLTAVAEHGRGGFYHLTDPVQLAGIVQAELDRPRRGRARGGVITVVPRPGVRSWGPAPASPPTPSPTAACASPWATWAPARPARCPSASRCPSAAVVGISPPSASPTPPSVEAPPSPGRSPSPTA
ncbi:MAG: hypothetical protein R3F43_21240 [bacterium]